jgi:Zn-dependent peptidase ImmA (M78 family)/transcriptional regulator with XRE-family HTH domain
MAGNDFNLRVEPKVLVHARLSLHGQWTDMEYAAKELDIPVADLKAIETGRKVPKISLLRRMAQKYKRSLTYLLLDEVPPEKPLPKDHRTVDSKPLGALLTKDVLAIRQARSLAMADAELRRAMGMPISKFPFQAHMREDSSDWGRRLRKHLGLVHLAAEGVKGKDAVEMAVDAVSSLGVLVLRLNLDQNGLRGFSLLDESVPVIVVRRSSKDAPSIKLFTLMHELAHILLRQGGMCDLKEGNTQRIEQWCNEFAAEALFPMAELLEHPVVRDHVRQNAGEAWRRMELIDIAKGRHVGPEVILRRLLDAGLTNHAFYKANREKWADKQYGRAKTPVPRDTVKERVNERSATFVRLVFNALDRQRIDSLQVTELLNMPFSDLGHARQLVMR